MINNKIFHSDKNSSYEYENEKQSSYKRTLI